MKISLRAYFLSQNRPDHECREQQKSTKKQHTLPPSRPALEWQGKLNEALVRRAGLSRLRHPPDRLRLRPGQKYPPRQDILRFACPIFPRIPSPVDLWTASRAPPCPQGPPGRPTRPEPPSWEVPGAGTGRPHRPQSSRSPGNVLGRQKPAQKNEASSIHSKNRW